MSRRSLAGKVKFLTSEVIKKILQHLGLWEESDAPPGRDPVVKEITFDPPYSQVI